VVDLGLNTVSHYRTSAEMIVTPPLEVVTMPEPDSGPRHLVVHPSAPWAFVINELDSTVSTLPYSHLTGALHAATSTVSSLRPEENATDMAGGGERCVVAVMSLFN
jgi:6-phosphogluconolactonase